MSWRYGNNGGIRGPREWRCGSSVREHEKYTTERNMALSTVRRVQTGLNKSHYRAPKETSTPHHPLLQICRLRRSIYISPGSRYSYSACSSSWNTHQRRVNPSAPPPPTTASSRGAPCSFCTGGDVAGHAGGDQSYRCIGTPGTTGIITRNCSNELRAVGVSIRISAQIVTGHMQNRG